MISTLETPRVLTHILDQLDCGLDADVRGEQSLLEQLESVAIDHGPILDRGFQPIEDLGVSHQEPTLELAPQVRAFHDDLAE